MLRSFLWSQTRDIRILFFKGATRYIIPFDLNELKHNTYTLKKEDNNLILTFAPTLEECQADLK